MKSKTIKKLYTLHSWVGIITGVLLFVIAFTGAISVFGRPEIKVWANPEIRALKPVDSQRVEQLVSQYAKEVPEHYKEEVMIFLPGNRGFQYLTIVFEAHSGEPADDNEKTANGEHIDGEHVEEEHHGPAMGILYDFHPQTLELVKKQHGTIEEIFASREYDMSEFIVGFHADLHLGRPIGLLTTGVLGLTMMLSIITGIFIHRKILAQFFTFRPRKSRTLLLNDGHKAIGVWGLLFNSVIAFTGAFLGLAVVVLLPAAAFVSFGGDQDKLIETFIAVPEPVIQHIHEPTQIGNIIDASLKLDDDLSISGITVMGYNDASAVVYVNVFGGKAMSSQTAVFKGDGEFVEVNGIYGKLDGFTGEVLDVLFPLHFGNFGGIFVKFIWAVLGLGTALLPLTGLMLWMERGVNAANPKYSMKTYQRFNRFIVGGCGGIVVCTLALFPAQLYINHVMNIANAGPLLKYPFYGIWLAVLAYAAVVKCEKKAAKQIAYLSAGLLIAIMPLNIITSGSHLFNVFSNGHFISVGIDLTALIAGIYLIRATKKYSQSEHAQEHEENLEVSDMQQEVLK